MTRVTLCRVLLDVLSDDVRPRKAKEAVLALLNAVSHPLASALRDRVQRGEDPELHLADHMIESLSQVDFQTGFQAFWDCLKEDECYADGLAQTLVDSVLGEKVEEHVGVLDRVGRKRKRSLPTCRHCRSEQSMLFELCLACLHMVWSAFRRVRRSARIFALKEEALELTTEQLLRLQIGAKKARMLSAPVRLGYGQVCATCKQKDELTECVCGTLSCKGCMLHRTGAEGGEDNMCTFCWCRLVNMPSNGSDTE